MLFEVYLKERNTLMKRIRELPCDMLIVGGGITGACIARDAAIRGIRVVLVEKRDFAWGTSSRSSKLIHGGFRYLEQLDFRLVFEGTQERATLSKIASHLVRPVPFVYPLYRGEKYGRLAVGAGMWLYDLLATFKAYRRHKMLNVEAMAERVPLLEQKGLAGGAIYYDAMTYDAALTVAMIEDAVNRGAFCVNYVAYEGVKYQAGNVVGARIRDRETNELCTIKTPWIIHAAGPYTDDVQSRAGLVGSSRVRPTKGSHIVVSREKLPLDAAVVMKSRRDQRVTFALPWGPVTVVGTTDTDFRGDLHNLNADREDVDYLLDVTRDHFPDLVLNYEDIICTWAGLRPLLKDDQAESYTVSREHAIYRDPAGILTVCGGKLTTCRKMAEDVVDCFLEQQSREYCANIRRCATHEIFLNGAEGITSVDDLERWASSIESILNVDADVAEYLVQAYGSRTLDLFANGILDNGGGKPLVEGLPYLVAEIDIAVEKFFARKTSDVLVRRLPLFFKDADQGIGVAPMVSRRIADLLGRSDAEAEEDLQEYQHEVANSRRWKEES